MKRFLKHILFFSFIFWGSLALLIYASGYIVKKKADFKLASNINKIIIGHSQPECAYNDSLITNFKNLSSSAELYFYNYQKLKEVLRQNPQVKTIFIEFSTNSILQPDDEKTWGELRLNRFLPYYYPYLGFQDHQLLFKNNIGGYLHATLKSLKQNIHRITTNNYNFIDSIGGYKYLKRQKATAALKHLKNKQIEKKTLEDRAISTVSLAYLEKMVQWGKAHGIKMYLIRSPYHKLYPGNAYETSFQKIRKERFGEVEFLDFKDFPVEDSDFGDLQHLNFMGAKKYSEWFESWLKDHAL